MKAKKRPLAWQGIGGAMDRSWSATIHPHLIEIPVSQQGHTHALDPHRVGGGGGR